eukprot:scaffold2827_cov54-Phaeocystis_antarctica.AAC.1
MATYAPVARRRWCGRAVGLSTMAAPTPPSRLYCTVHQYQGAAGRRQVRRRAGDAAGRLDAGRARQPYRPALGRTGRRLPHVPEAATPCARGCNPMHRAGHRRRAAHAGAARVLAGQAARAAAGRGGAGAAP